MYSNIFVLLVVCVYFGYTKDLPSYVKPCSVSAPDFDDCCLEHGKEAIPSLVKGDKKYNIPNLTPLVLPKVTLESDRTFNLILKDVALYGLDTVELKDVKFDVNNKKVRVVAYLNTVNIIGKYDIDGKILVVPIQGNGDINVTGVGLEVQYDLKYTLEPTNGEDYIVPKEGKSDYKVKNAYFHLDNLFNGNKQLGDSTNQLLNDEPLKFLDAIKPVITETLTTVITSIVSGITSVVPYKKWFLD